MEYNRTYGGGSPPVKYSLPLLYAHMHKIPQYNTRNYKVIFYITI